MSVFQLQYNLDEGREQAGRHCWVAFTIPCKGVTDAPEFLQTSSFLILIYLFFLSRFPELNVLEKKQQVVQR